MPTSAPRTDPGTALTAARRRDVDRRQQRVRQALDLMRVDGSEITISAVAARAQVHRSFIHRHPALRAAVCAAADDPLPGAQKVTSQTSRRSLEADNLNLLDTNRRLGQRIADLEHRLSEMLGEQVFARTGLGAARDHSVLENRITELQHQLREASRQLDERGEELAASREAHRRLMAETNRSTDGRDR